MDIARGVANHKDMMTTDQYSRSGQMSKLALTVVIFFVSSVAKINWTYFKTN